MKVLVSVRVLVCVNQHDPIETDYPSLAPIRDQTKLVNGENADDPVTYPSVKYLLHKYKQLKSPHNMHRWQKCATAREHVGGFDLVYFNGHVELPSTDCGHSTFLGAVINNPVIHSRRSKSDKVCVWHAMILPADKCVFIDLVFGAHDRPWVKAVAETLFSKPAVVRT